jgi:hypothetical protein
VKHTAEGDHYQCNLIKTNDRKKLTTFLRCNYFRFVHTRHKVHLALVDLWQFVSASDGRKRAKSERAFIIAALFPFQSKSNNS